jgi:excisionase family DNA binding protein
MTEQHRPRRRVPVIGDVAVVDRHALIAGHPAWFIARLLVDLPGGLEARLARFGLPSERHGDVLRAVHALRYAGTAWQLEQTEEASASASDSGSPIQENASAAVRSKSHDGLLSTSAAANILGVCDRRVRMLAAAGELPGHRDGGRWLFEPEAVAAARERRR